MAIIFSFMEKRFLLNTWRALSDWLKAVYVVFAFLLAFFLGALKGLLVGPVAGVIIIVGNIGVILCLLPLHFTWTVYTVSKTKRFDGPLKVALLFALPALFAIWLALSTTASVLLGVGYGFFTPWVSAFEAFRQQNEFKKYLHCVMDGTWGTIKGSCTIVRDFADLCYHSYPLYLNELRNFTASDEIKTLLLVHVPGCIIVGLMGLIVEVPLYTVISIIKSPYLLFRGWQRLIHDLASREGPFFETACVPVAGLTILFWPLIVVGTVLLAFFSSFFVGLYGSVVVFQERSFRKGAAYVIAMVAEFDEYTNDLLYLPEGSILPKPRYRRMKPSGEVSVGRSYRGSLRPSSIDNQPSPPAMLVPSLAPSRSVRETIHEVKVVQIWRNMRISCEMRGKELLDANVIRQADLYEWLKAKSGCEASIVGVGLPCYSFLQTLIYSIKAGSGGLLLFDDFEITHMNRPQDRLLDWFFHPVMVLKEQIQVLKLGEGEIRYLEKLILLGSDEQRVQAWNNGCMIPEDGLRAAQIQGMARRMTGMIRSLGKFPTYRRRFQRIVKDLVAYSSGKEGSTRSESIRSIGSIDLV